MQTERVIAEHVKEQIEEAMTYKQQNYNEFLKDMGIEQY